MTTNLHHLPYRNVASFASRLDELPYSEINSWWVPKFTIVKLEIINILGADLLKYPRLLKVISKVGAESAKKSGYSGNLGRIHDMLVKLNRKEKT